MPTIKLWVTGSGFRNHANITTKWTIEDTSKGGYIPTGYKENQFLRIINGSELRDFNISQDRKLSVKAEVSEEEAVVLEGLSEKGRSIGDWEEQEEMKYEEFLNELLTEYSARAMNK